MAVSFAPVTYELFSGANATQLVTGSGSPASESQGGLIVNLDLLNSAMVGGYGVNANDPVNFATVPPLGSIEYDGTEDIYANAFPGQRVEVQVLPGIKNWTPSPAEVAAQIAALGLATEVTQQLNHTAINGVNSTLGAPAQNLAVLQVNSTLGAPAQDGSVQAVHTVLGTPAQNPSLIALNSGIPTQMLQAGVGVTSEIAALIATGSALGAPGGTPLLALSNVFANPGGQTFTTGQTRVYGAPSPFGQISYEIFIFLTSNASETNPIFQVELDWFNSASGQVISTERWFMNGGISPGGNSYVGTGRAKGDALQVSITNNGTLTSGNCQVVIMQTSRVYIKDDFRSTFYGGTPGIPNGGYDTDANILLATAPTVGPNSTVKRSMALYAGTVTISGVTQVGNIGAAALSVDENDNSLSNSNVFQIAIPASSFAVATFDLPRKQCTLSISNKAGTSQAIAASIIISEQNV